MSFRTGTLRLCAALAIGSIPAAAANAATAVTCDPNAPPVRAVGNTTTDASCTDDTIQSAIDNAVCPNTKIFITTERTYAAQHLLIQDKSLSLIGTSASCGGVSRPRPDTAEATPTAPVVTLEGSGNGGTSVLAIRGTGNVTLQFLEFTQGSGGAGSRGGGIDFQGAGSLTLDTTTVDFNSADFGGGIGFVGVNSSALLGLNAYTVIESNSAGVDGGGIEIEGTAELVAAAPFTRIDRNQAVNGKGGGVAVVSPAHADIGSSGYGPFGVLDGNSAALGGGMSGEVRNSGQLLINLFTTDPLHPVTLSNNFASQGGGALYVLPHGDGLAVACLAEFRIAANTAPDGAAVLIDADVGTNATPATADLELNTNFLFCPNAFAHETCAPGVSCNVFEGNVNADGANVLQPGATVTQRATFIGEFAGSRFAMRGNAGAQGIRTIDAKTRIDNCLIAGNSYAAEAVRIDAGGDAAQPPALSIDSCTVVDNAPNGGSVIHTDYDLTLTDSIIDQPSMAAVSTGNSPVVTAHNLLVADPTGLAAQPDIVAGEPTFTGAARGDYRLRAVVQNDVVTASLGIDFAASGGGNDLNGNPRDQDIPSVADRFGVRDVGCYEAQLIVDRIFADAFSDPIPIVR